MCHLKLPDYEFTPEVRKDLSLVDVLNTVQIIINNGRYQMREVSTLPNWIGEQGEHLLYINGSVRRLYFWDDVNSTWEFIEFYNSGRGQTTIVATVNLTAQAAAITTTTFFTPGGFGLFRVNVYMKCSVVGVGTLSCTIVWTDEVSGESVSPAGTVDLSSTNNGSTGMTFLASGASAITYATAISGLSGSPKYDIFIVLEQLL